MFKRLSLAPTGNVSSKDYDNISANHSFCIRVLPLAETSIRGSLAALLALVSFFWMCQGL